MNALEGFVIGYSVVVSLFAMAFAVVVYIFEAKALSAMARNRGIAHPGLAWVPIANYWVMGSIADDYDARVGVDKRWRKRLLTLAIITMVVALVSTAAICVRAILLAESGALDDSMETILAFYAEISVFMIPLSVLGTLLSIWEYIVAFKIFRSCRGQKIGLIFFAISLVASIAFPFLLFACRNYIDGRKADENVIDVVDSNGNPVY